MVQVAVLKDLVPLAVVSDLSAAFSTIAGCDLFDSLQTKALIEATSVFVTLIVEEKEVLIVTLVDLSDHVWHEE